MSLLWRDQLRIGLSPEQVTVVRVARGTKGRAIEKHSFACSPAQPAWMAALHTLSQHLPQLASKPAEVTVILSSQLVRFAVLPWSAALDNPAEEQALARIRFEQTYGERAHHWELRVADGGYGEMRLVSAIDRELLDALSAVFAPTRLQLVSIQPFLAAAFNHCRRRLSAADYFFVTAESGKVGIAQFRQGRWAAVRTLKLEGDFAEQLPLLLRREAVMAGMEQAQVQVYAYFPEQPNFSWSAGSGLNVEILAPKARDGYSPFSDAKYGMALSGMA